MKYHLKEYFAAYPEFISHKVFNTWEEVVEEFGWELAESNYGHDAEYCPGKSEGLEFGSSIHGSMVRDDGVQEYSVTDDDGQPILRSFEVEALYTTVRTAIFEVDALTIEEAEKKIDAMIGDHDFNQHTPCGGETEIACIITVDSIRQNFGILDQPQVKG